jgi:hypothetical protein
MMFVLWFSLCLPYLASLLKVKIYAHFTVHIPSICSAANGVHVKSVFWNVDT